MTTVFDAPPARPLMPFMEQPAPSPPASPVEPAPSHPSFHRWSAEEYERMIVLGVLTTDHKVELLDGYLINKMSEGLPHGYALRKLNLHFCVAANGRWVPQCQQAVILDGPSLPEPDIALFQPPEEAYARRRPGPADFILFVEVSETSLAFDRGDKLRAYARAGVPEYWIVNLPERVVEVHQQPDPAAGRYQAVRLVSPGESVAPAAFPDAAIAVADLLG